AWPPSAALHQRGQRILGLVFQDARRVPQVLSVGGARRRAERFLEDQQAWCAGLRVQAYVQRRKRAFGSNAFGTRDGPPTSRERAVRQGEIPPLTGNRREGDLVPRNVRRRQIHVVYP